MKVKKLLAGVLSTAMVLSTLTMPAFAEGNEFEVGSGWAMDFIPETSSISVIFSKFPKLTNTEEMTVKLYHDDILLSTTKAQEKFINSEEYNNGTGTTIRVAGKNYSTGEIIDPSGSWNTELKAPWTAERIPNKIVVDYKGETTTFEDFEYCAADNYSKFSFAPTSKDLEALIKADTTGEIDLVDTTYVIDKEVDIDKNVTIKNGNFDFDGVEVDDNAPFWVNSNAEVTFDDCKFYGENYSSSYGVVYAENSAVTLDECDFTFTNEVIYDEDEEMGGILKGADIPKSTFKVTDSTFTLKDTVRVIALATVDMDNVTINATHKSTSTEHFFRNVYGTIKNSTVKGDNFQNGIKNSSEGSLNLVNSTVELTNMAQKVINLSDGAKVYADAKSAELFTASDVEALTPAEGYYFDDADGKIKESKSNVIDTASASGVTVQLDDLRLNDDIDHTKDATYEVVVSNVSKDDKAKVDEVANIAIAAGQSVLAYDIKVVKTENGKEETVNVRNQKVTLTLPTPVTPGTDVKLYHINNGVQEQINDVVVSADGKTITFTAPSFSAYVVTYNAAAVAEGDVTSNITVDFEPVATKQNEYDIVLKAEAGKKINGLTTADLTFVLTQGTTGDVSYEIKPAANINLLNPSENRYEFNFDGINAHNATAERIVIGKVVFGGYCTGANFAIENAATNIVHTTKTANSIVDEYTVGGTNALNVTAKIDPLTIAEETKTLAINVEFPNKVNKNVAAYQDMKISIVSANSNEEIALGDDMTADGKYVVTRDLVKNTAYTVTVTGAGYRTARCNVTMTDNKTLNFWNNVKDSAAEVETGNAASAKTTTFLAGELVKDGKINIYDLSAVVSYFGTTNDTASASDYAKYDLNRDGKIDSKDVAYVLVSWGK